MSVCARPTPRAVAELQFVENAPFRAAINRAVWLGVVSWGSLAVEVGVTESALTKAFGRGGGHGRRYVRYERAVEIVRALGLDPVDFGV